MLDLFNLLCSICKLTVDVLLLLLILYSFWYGARLETGDLVIEIYGISKYFK